MKFDRLDIFQSIQDLRSDYTKLLLEALKEGLLAVKRAKETGGYIRKYRDFPKLSFRKNGLPILSFTSDTSPTDFRGYFTSLGNLSEPFANTSDLSLGNFIKHLVNEKHLVNTSGF